MWTRGDGNQTASLQNWWMTAQRNIDKEVPGKI